jgi:hypothetical protein
MLSYLHTDYMTHALLWSVLDAQRANATLSGEALRDAGRQLAEFRTSGPAVLMAFDAAGERIIGAALAVTDRELPVYDYTVAFPARTTCLLVGGYVAGPVGIAAAATAATRAGAARVEVALLGGWHEPISGVARIGALGASSAAVA